MYKFLFILLLSLCALCSQADCIDVTLSSEHSSQQINLTAGVIQCLTINNQTGEHAALLINHPGSTLSHISGNSSIESKAIFGNIYKVFKHRPQQHILLNIDSSLGTNIKGMIGSYSVIDEINLKNHALSFLLLGLIFACMTINLLYGIMNKSHQAILLMLLSATSINYFICEAIINMADSGTLQKNLIIKASIFLCCLTGLMLVHAFIKQQRWQHKLFSAILLSLLTIGFLPYFDLSSYRYLTSLLIVYVTVLVLRESLTNKHLYWYFIGSLLPSVLSMLILHISEIIPALSIYNVALASIILQNLLTMKTINASAIAEESLSQKYDDTHDDQLKQQFITLFKHIAARPLNALLHFADHHQLTLGRDDASHVRQQIQLSLLKVQINEVLTSPQTATREQAVRLIRQLLNTLAEVEAEPGSQCPEKLHWLLDTSNTGQDEFNAWLSDCQQLAEKFGLNFLYSPVLSQHSFISLLPEQTASSAPPADHWLIIEDSPSLLQVINSQCQLIQQACLLADSVDTALRTYLSHNALISHILLDWNLGNTTAQQLLHQMRLLQTKHQLLPCKIIIMSAQQLPAALRQEIGNIEIISKPISTARLSQIKNTH